MHYLFLGDQTHLKNQKIDELKNKFIQSNDASNFDCEILHANKLSPADLKKSLMTLPVVSKNRLVIIRHIEKLSPHNKEIILEFIEQVEKQTVLICDSDKVDQKNSFIKKFSAKAKVQRYQSAPKRNVFDMTKAMSGRNPTEALNILSDLIEQGDHPLQIMGALVWFWGKNRNRVDQDKFRSGLVTLKEADLNIKRSRLQPANAVEVAVVKLCSLIAY